MNLKDNSTLLSFREDLAAWCMSNYSKLYEIHIFRICAYEIDTLRVQCILNWYAWELMYMKLHLEK